MKYFKTNAFNITGRDTIMCRLLATPRPQSLICGGPIFKCFFAQKVFKNSWDGMSIFFLF